MTPQSHFTIFGALADDRERPLRELLATMNSSSSVCDPQNTLVPFAQCTQLHVARFFVIDDPTLSDRAAYGVTQSRPPKYLVFLGDCDGPSDAFLTELATLAGNGLRQIFSHCTDFNAQTDLLRWLKAHEVPVAATCVTCSRRTAT